MTFEAIVDEIRTLSVAERKALLNVIVDSLTEPTKTRSLLELEGLGAEILGRN